MTLRLNGSTSGYVEIDSPAVGGNNTIQLPTSNGSANQFLKNGSTAGTLGWSSMVEDSSGRVLVGTSSTATAGNAQYAFLQVRGNSFSTANNAILNIGRGEAATSITSGEDIGNINFTDSSGNEFAEIKCTADGNAGSGSYPGRITFHTTSSGSGSFVERMRITSGGYTKLTNNASYNSATGTFHEIYAEVTTTAQEYLRVMTNSGEYGTRFFAAYNSTAPNAANSVAKIGQMTATGRSINATGSINASGADYAEYMIKAGDFTITKGAVCGVTADGLLTLDYTDAVSFVVKSTNPSYVGADTWGSEDVVGLKPDADDADALARWEADLEAARQKVDRIAFAGQVPVNVTGATPGQYIVPIEAADGGIEGIAKNEADLTLAEYMRAVGKVIAIEDDGRARIIVKVA